MYENNEKNRLTFWWITQVILYVIKWNFFYLNDEYCTYGPLNWQLQFLTLFKVPVSLKIEYKKNSFTTWKWKVYQFDLSVNGLFGKPFMMQLWWMKSEMAFVHTLCIMITALTPSSKVQNALRVFGNEVRSNFDTFSFLHTNKVIHSHLEPCWRSSLPLSKTAGSLCFFRG